MGRAAVAPADRVPVPCSITVPLKRLKHFDCKDKQALLVGGFGRLCERLVRGQGPLRSPGHRGRVGRGVPASTSGCLRPAAPRRGRQGRVPGGGSSRSSRRPFPGCPEGRRGPGPRDGGRCPPWPHAARARAPRAAACSSVLSTASPMGRDLSERRARPEAVPLVPAPKRWAWARGAATRPFAGSRGHAALTLLLPQNRGLAPRGGRCRGHVSPCRGCHGFRCLPSRLSSLVHAAPDPSSAGRPCRARGRGVEPVSGALPWSPRARHVRRAGAPGPRGVCASSAAVLAWCSGRGEVAGASAAAWPPRPGCGWVALGTSAGPRVQSRLCGLWALWASPPREHLARVSEAGRRGSPWPAWSTCHTRPGGGGRGLRRPPGGPRACRPVCRVRAAASLWADAAHRAQEP